MSDTEKWGVGSKADARAFATTLVEGKPVELIIGEHPHSRSDERTYARFADGTIESFSGHRLLVDVQIESLNYLKESELSGNDVRRGGVGRIWFNGVQVHEFGFRDPLDALRTADQTIRKLSEFHFPYWDEAERQKLIGRKVFYRDEPAVVSGVNVSEGKVLLVPDFKYIQSFRVPAWVGDGEDEETAAYERDCWADDYSRGIYVSVLSPDIWWFRKGTAAE